MELSSPADAASLSQLLNILRDLRDENRQLFKAVRSIEGRLDLLSLQRSYQTPISEGSQDARTGPSPPDMQRQSLENTTQPICPPSPSSVTKPDVPEAIGAHGGSYSVYHALAVASKDLDVDHKPDFTNTEPAVNLGPFPQWANAKKIVSLDPLGHIAPWLFESTVRSENIHLRPTIAITKAHMKLPELEHSVRAGRLVPDGKICLNATGELAVTKFAVEPVWYLPGVAERFGIGKHSHDSHCASVHQLRPRTCLTGWSPDEGTLRRSLFENTGGSFPELITRGDMKLFLPPIGGLTVYCFGDPSRMSDPTAKLALRIHDECNGSDVFGSDICTCRPYLIFGVEEAVKEAQRGGSGVVVYFRKEGRALGEVTKYLVYNARKNLSITMKPPLHG
ncbi:MAG: hypothetical protein Q9222_000780 [Ikaeria aurantiellina]